VEGIMTYEVFAWARPWFSDSTNTLILLTNTIGRIGPYLKTAAVFKCPWDRSWILLGGAKHPRVRSYAMNTYMGYEDGAPQTPLIFRRMSDLVVPPPAKAFVFIDTHEDSIFGGLFVIGSPPAKVYDAWDNLPASRHNGAATLSFADGHAETRRWTDRSILVPPERVYRYGAWTRDVGDIAWLKERATRPPP
jgi:prepilin-type processing-associated H-X9-DG protein